MSDHEAQNYKNRIGKAMLRLLAYESNDDSEKRWLINRIGNERISKHLHRISPLALHTLDAIWKKGPINGVAIADELDVTKGAISKVTARLLDYGFIRKEKHPGNKKEIYFSATQDGGLVADCHQAMHQKMDQQSIALMSAYTAKDLDLIAGFLEKLADLRRP
ncbi:MarR family transcriptional regulator [Sporolactobacillus shoreicorticis]|uniref:MarR family transcriptional regulator n=1 Tax=Sporolactobacillus shoreicorticis TaxID=1923877 RepID=A0ABW5RZY3_9BACL|nr:MarR family transcriptional regulator [Sporolactobacillus shoreicorticis]MCO7127222.1 MarR family transcriptional regulator [Sporolactobacillus shoreicorticis]